MIKKVGHIVIILLLLLGTGGVTITKHYCGSTLVGSGIFSASKDCCHGPCKGCRNETKVFKITDSFDFTDQKLSFGTDFKYLNDNYGSLTAALLPGFGQLVPGHLFLPIKDHPHIRVPAGDQEAILQCFRL